LNTDFRKVEQHFNEASAEYDKYKYDVNDPSKKIFLIRQQLLIKTLTAIGHKHGTMLDCGCGTGENIIALKRRGFDIDGFDLSHNMVSACQEKLESANMLDVNVWRDNICHFTKNIKRKYDIASVMGVLQYIDEETRKKAYEEISLALQPRGVVILSYVNSLFDLFTFNKFTIKFLKDNFIPLSVWTERESEILTHLESLITSPKKKGKEGSRSETAHGYIPIHSTNPLLVAEELKKNGFEFQCIRFFHFHALPPLIKDKLRRPEEFLENSISMEINLAESWYGYFMAYQFFVVATKSP